MNETQNSKRYDLEDRTIVFAKEVRKFVKKLHHDLANMEDGKQLIRSSGSVGANYIEVAGYEWRYGSGERAGQVGAGSRRANKYFRGNIKENKLETLNPKFETILDVRNKSRIYLAFDYSAGGLMFRVSTFGFRILKLFRISIFEFRIY
jgi:hypothetical protein